MLREETKKIKIGNLYVGDDAPVSIQSMCNTPAHDFDATLNQVIELEKAGCDIIRVAVPDKESAQVIPLLKQSTQMPIVADIHFDYLLAIESIEQGADKIRINPGNIGDKERVKKVVDCAKLNNIPIRVGVNSGSIKKDVLQKYGNTAKALVKSCIENIRIIESCNYDQLVVSLKASSVTKTYEAYTEISERINYPLHLGVTESGTMFSGTIKSSAGIGGLLLAGLGNTIRVSLTDNPVEEIKVATQLLRALGLREQCIEIISCPTCGRTQIDLINLAKKVEQRTQDIRKPLKIAVMGCVVNGPGEAKEADYGIAGGIGKAVVFKKGQPIGTYSENEAIEKLLILISQDH